VAFCLACGFTVRFFEGNEPELPAACPGCGGEIRSRCPACGSLIASAFAVECEECDTPLRPDQLFGTAIRKSGK